ncbi:MAG: hypothetical protein FWC73_03680 [Defluviitaleaceae bacterium]|nr:hypothetical protein [Defluviitaleaceae bacterium]
MWFFIILLAVALVIATIYALRIAFRRADDISETHKQATAFMNECESRILVMKMSYKEYDQPLNSLYELVKYSDKSGTSELDWKIDPLLTRLELALADTDGEDVTTVIDEVKLLFERRKTEIRESKRGQF